MIMKGIGLLGLFFGFLLYAHAFLLPSASPSGSTLSLSPVTSLSQTFRRLQAGLAQVSTTLSDGHAPPTKDLSLLFHP